MDACSSERAAKVGRGALRVKGPQNDEMKLTKPGFALSFAAYLGVIRSPGPGR